MLDPMKNLIISLIVIFGFVSCSSLTLLPESQIDSMGRQSFEEMKKKTPASKNPRYVQPTQCIVRHLLEKNGFKAKEWELVVFASDQLNAFALPGKKIGVYEGLFKAAKNQHQLAAVIGHEIAHVELEHGNKRVSNELLIAGVMLGTSVGLQNNENRDIILAGLGLGATVGAKLPFSRGHESEADALGLEYMAKAGFDPRQAVNLWQNMGAASGGKTPPEFLSTHPSSGTRIKDIQKQLPKTTKMQDAALDKYGAPNCGY